MIVTHINTYKNKNRQEFLKICRDIDAIKRLIDNRDMGIVVNFFLQKAIDHIGDKR